MRWKHAYAPTPAALHAFAELVRRLHRSRIIPAVVWVDWARGKYVTSQPDEVDDDTVGPDLFDESSWKMMVEIRYAVCYSSRTRMLETIV